MHPYNRRYCLLCVSVFSVSLCEIFFPLSSKASSPRTVHVFVALCDNEHQGIVPVSATLGNGDDPAANLYWGALYGVKTHLKKSASWKLISCGQAPDDAVLERCIFKSADNKTFLAADAYRGSEIRRAVTDFLYAAAGKGTNVISVADGDKKIKLSLAGGSDLAVYVGHDGLMDFSLDSYPQGKKNETRDVMVLACASKAFFADALRAANANPLLWTTGLLAPEAYILEAALAGWTRSEAPAQIRDRAAAAYNRYQSCGLKAAKNLFVSGF